MDDVRKDAVRKDAVRKDAVRRQERRLPPELGEPMKAMSPGVVDFLFRQLVTGRPAEDVEWTREGTVLAEQLPGAELVRRLADTDIEALTPRELFDFVRAAQRLEDWAARLREDAVARYCAPNRRAPGGIRGGKPA